MCSNCKTISQVVALTVVSLRIAMATVTDLQFHSFGACVALAWIIPSAVNKILWCSLQQQENWPALAYATAHNFETVFLQILFKISYYYYKTKGFNIGQKPMPKSFSEKPPLSDVPTMNRLMWKTTPIAGNNALVRPSWCPLIQLEFC